MGLEFITQPQVFTQRLTALGGIEGYVPPFVSSFYTWTSTSPVTASAFPLPGSIGLLDIPGSYIVSVGGVLQSPTNYTINVPTRTLTFDFTVNADTPVVITQIGTVGLSSIIDSLSVGQFVTPRLSAINGNIDNLLVTNLTALSSVLQVTDIQLYEMSGFNVQGNVGVNGNVSVNGVLSAREIDLIHTPANDGVDPILDIGETTTEGFSGFRVRYEENTNRLLIQTVASSLTSNSVIIDRATGQVGISAVPNQALTVVGNISATGAIRAINNWPNRQYRILSADEVPFAANTGTVLWSATPLTVQPNYIYTVSFYIAISSTGSSPAYTFALSGSAPFTILEGTATGNVTNESGNPYFARDLRELNTGTPTNTHVAIPARTYTSVGPHGFSISPIISAATTTQIVLSCFSNTLSRVKSSSNYSGSLIQTV